MTSRRPWNLVSLTALTLPAGVNCSDGFRGSAEKLTFHIGTGPSRGKKVLTLWLCDEIIHCEHL
jgi:hypothetical protein